MPRQSRSCHVVDIFETAEVGKGDARAFRCKVASALTADETKKATRKLQLWLGANVKAARLDLGLTQEVLGTQTGRGRVYIQRIESGSTNVTLETLVSLTLALSRSVTELLQPPDEGYKSHDVNQVGSQVSLQPGDLAIVLPAGQAFEAGQVLAGYLGKEVPLIDPDTRTVSGVAGIPPHRRGNS